MNKYTRSVMNKIEITTEFIKLDSFLKFLGAVSMGSEAKMLILDELIKVIPKRKAKYRQTMKPEVEFQLNRMYISYNRKGHRAFAVF